MAFKIHVCTAAHHGTWFLGTRFHRAIPLVFVVGYPKSGTTWAGQLAADYLQLPFPRFSLLPVGFPAVVHGHERVWKRYPRGIYVMRDGRDAMVSHYFFLTRWLAEGDHPPMSRRVRRSLGGLVNKADVRGNMARFIERQMTRPESARVNWARHVQSFYEVKNPNVVLLRYEDLLRDGESALAKAMSELTGEEADLDRVRETVARFSFGRQSQGRPGSNGPPPLLRKGRHGDWVNHFTREAAEIIDEYCGEMLVATGYEPDREWVRRFAELPAEYAAHASVAGNGA